MAKKTVLIVDDEQFIRLLVVQTLENEYFVLEAKDGQEAVEVAKRKKPDMILMDVMMPKKDGLTALQEIKQIKETKEIPVVMLTGVGYELNVQYAKSIGASSYVTKPVRAKDLLALVNKYLAPTDK